MVTLLRAMLAAIVVMLFASQVFAAESQQQQSDRERKVKVALALSEKSERCPKRVAKVEAVLTSEREKKVTQVLCECSLTGDCKCTGGKCECECCTNDLPTSSEAGQKAYDAKKPLLAFYGVKGRCIDGAIAGQGKTLPAGLDPAKPIVVYAPHADGYKPIQQFAATATNAEISVAIREAAAEMKRGVTVTKPETNCSNGQCQTPATIRRR